MMPFGIRSFLNRHPLLRMGAAGIQLANWHIKPPFVPEIAYIIRVNKRSPYERLERL